MSKKLAPLWIIIAGCLWGTMGIFVRIFNSYDVEAMSIVFVRSLFTAIITFTAAAAFNRKSLKIKLKDIWIFAGTGLISIVIFNFCYFTAISMMSLSAAAILLYMSPIFVMIFSAIFFREKITLKKISAMVLSIIGLAFVTGIFGGTIISPLGIAYGVASAVSYSLYSIFSRAALKKGYNSLTVTGWSFAFSTIFSAFAADLPACFNMFKSTPSMMLYTLIFSIVASVLPYVFYSIGLKGIETGKAAIIASVEPVAATVIGFIIYRESPTISTIIGIILVLAALVLSIDIRNNCKKKDNETK